MLARLSRHKTCDLAEDGQTSPQTELLNVAAVEVLERTTRRWTALPLITRTVFCAAVWILGGAGQPEEAELTNLHARPELNRQGGCVRQLERHMTAEPRVDEASRGVRHKAQPTQGRLALQPRGKMVGQRDNLEA